MGKLAITGGKKIREKLFPYQTTISTQERLAVDRVMRSKQLSSYRGSWNTAFMGGVEVQAFEKEWSEKYKVKHCIAVNSCTSALQVACGAIGLLPGEEVIVTPWSMSCSATAPMVWGAKPIFADIERDNYCLDIESIKKFITNKTKAIIAVDLFGNPFNVEGLLDYCNDIGFKKIWIIEDAAQAVGARYKGKYIDGYAGSFGDLACFSFTQGKHLTSGEGGIITTNNDHLAMRCKLIRNHAEAVISDMFVQHEKNMSGDSDVPDVLNTFDWNNNMLGYNMRLTEIQAAIMREQLKKIDYVNEVKIKNCNYIMEELNKIPCIKSTGPREGCVHTYYWQPFQFDAEIAGVSREKFIDAVKAELTGEAGREDEGTSILIGNGYIKPLYRMPIFRNEFNPTDYPVVEDLWKNKVFGLRMSSPPISIDDLKDVVTAFWKVWNNREELK